MKTRQYVVNKWLIDLSSGFITHQETGEKKRLGEYQLNLLNVLLQHVGQIVSRDELTNLVWKRRVIGNNSLPNAVHTLRVALEDDKKQQRIIQTIPKLGYVLDPSFCETIEIEEAVQAIPVVNNNAVDSNAVDSNAVDTNNKEDAELSATDSQKNNTTASENVELSASLSKNEVLAAPGSEENNGNPEFESATATAPSLMLSPTAPAKRRVSKKNLFFFALSALIGVCGVIAFGVMYPTPIGVTYQATQQEKGAHGNIRMFQITDTRFEDQNSDNLYARLKDSLYRLDKDLKTKNAHMNIYYHISLRRLDYTISVTTACDQKQLNMTIYHWRQNNDLLNNVIYSESERKINEISTC